MKAAAIILGLVIGGFVLVGVGCGGVMVRSINKILHNNSSYGQIDFRLADTCTRGWWSKIFKDKKYIVLLQNNAELRPTGGFMGSYAKLKFTDLGLAHVDVEDIYQPDGQIVGHVEPPYPIQEAFGQGWWRLRDSNWEVDFTKAAPTIVWFFNQGGENDIDGLVAVNMGLVKQWLAVVGQIKLQTYDENITESNLYSLAQKYAESSDISSTSSKRDFLGAVGQKLLDETKNAGLVDKAKLFSLLINNLRSGEIWLWSGEKIVEEKIVNLGWGGKPKYIPGEDYFYLVEANLGVNKANSLIDRQVSQNVGEKTGSIEINWKNSNEFKTPKPPIFWGGDYLAYVRLVLPKDAVIEKLFVANKELVRRTEDAVPVSSLMGRSENKYNIDYFNDLQEVGFWIMVPAGDDLQAKITYLNPHEYGEIKIRRQPGMEEFKYTLSLDSKILWQGVVDRDKVLDIR